MAKNKNRKRNATPLLIKEIKESVKSLPDRVESSAEENEEEVNIKFWRHYSLGVI